MNMKMSTKRNWGLGLIILGVLFILDQNNVFGHWGLGDFFRDFWPLILIGAGLHLFNKNRINAAIFFIGLGTILQISILTNWRIWPLILVLIGFHLLYKDDVFNNFNLESLKRKSESKNKKIINQ
jgi:hypothetical protein